EGLRTDPKGTFADFHLGLDPDCTRPRWCSRAPKRAPRRGARPTSERCAGKTLDLDEDVAVAAKQLGFADLVVLGIDDEIVDRVPGGDRGTRVLVGKVGAHARMRVVDDRRGRVRLEAAREL